MSLPDWLAWAGALTGGAGLLGGGVAIAKIGPDRAKLRAEAATILTASSMEMSTKLSDRLDRAMARIDRLEDNEDIQREMLHRHAEWDRLMAAELRARGVDVPPPPNLFLPNTSVA